MERLIDANVLKTAMEDRIDSIPSNDYCQGWNAAINTALDEIENAPTVEPTFGMFREMLCAECGKRPQVKVLINGEQIYPQNCDADMRGEE